MNEPTNLDDTLIWRYGDPLYVMYCDREGGNAKFEQNGNIFQAHSIQKELVSIQLVNGTYMICVGNIFYNRCYRDELFIAVEKDKATYEWIRNCFNECRMHTVEQSVLFSLKGTTRITMDKKTGLWRLFLPDGRVQIGMGNWKAVSGKMKDYLSTRFMYYITSLFGLLEPIEVETAEEYNDSLSPGKRTSHKKNRLIKWVSRFADKFKRRFGRLAWMNLTFSFVSNFL